MFEDPISKFRQCLSAHETPVDVPIVTDGRLQRFHIKGDRAGTRNGWYVLFSDPIFAGAFGNWRTGEKYNWSCADAATFTPQEREAFKRRMAEAQRAREQESRIRQERARLNASSIWQASNPAPHDHPYLIKKHVKNHGLRIYKEALVIPMQDIKGTLHSLQFIDGEGNKRFLSGGQKKGCFFVIEAAGQSLAIAEGYSTAASIYESLRLPVAIAFDAGNLLNVAKAFRGKYTHRDIIICADNDTETEGNPGLTKAKQAAAAINARLAIPPISGDFNDFYNRGNNE